MPGVSAAILFADGTMWRATSGFADVALGAALTPTPSSRLRASPKTFLAALILKLREDGAIDLERPVVTYLRTWPSTDDHGP